MQEVEVVLSPQEYKHLIYTLLIDRNDLLSK